MYDTQSLEVDHCGKGNVEKFDNIYLRLEILARTAYIILLYKNMSRTSSLSHFPDDCVYYA